MQDSNRKAMWAKKSKTKQRILNFMNGETTPPPVPELVKFINEKSKFNAELDGKSKFHTGRTKSSGVRLGSGYHTKEWNVVVKDSNGNVVYNENINKSYPRPKDFAVWVHGNVMNRKHWRYGRNDAVSRGDDELQYFDAFDKQKIINEQNDPTDD